MRKRRIPSSLEAHPSDETRKALCFSRKACPRAVDRQTSEKICEKQRGFSEAELTDEELSEVFATCDDEIESSLISDAINRFLGSLEKKKRIIFVRRYWYMSDIRSISGSLGMSEGSVNMTLSRLRAELKKFLEKEGFEV